MTPVNTGAGEQNDPHVSGDLAAYTDGTPLTSQTIRYYRFSTGADQAVASPAGARDLLSDVSGNRIVFTRIQASGNSIMVFDAAAASTSEVAPMAGSNRIGAAIGNTTVAYIEFNSVAVGSTHAVDLAGGAPVQLSSGAGTSQNPAVAPSGNVVVWEQCSSSIIACDVMQSVRTGGVWGPATLVASGAVNSDTDGVNVVYESGGDIYFKPVAGGAATQLTLAGNQVNPSISSGVIGFESNAVGDLNADVFIYVVATNTMFRVTNTPAVNEQLNDISILPNGDVRVVWAANDGLTGDNNIYARTFTLPGIRTPAQLIADLVDKTLRFLDRMLLGPVLRAKLEQIASAVIQKNKTLACAGLNQYIAAVNATSWSALTTAEKAELVADANAIKAAIGCP
jgi:hypothetical protein